jgi:hypothetical protein
MSKTERAILRIFSKRHGLQLNKQGSDYLVQVLSELALDTSDQHLLDSLDFIAKAYLQYQRKSFYTLLQDRRQG